MHIKSEEELDSLHQIVVEERLLAIEDHLQSICELLKMLVEMKVNGA